MPKQALDRMLRAIALFDLYGGLLTERQREFFDLHYMRDLSLAEISEQYGVSRQSVHDTLTRGESYLERIETSLGLLEKTQAALVAVRRATDKCKELQDLVRDQCCCSSGQTQTLIEQLIEDLSCAADLLIYGPAARRD